MTNAKKEDWPEELSEPRADQFTRGVFQDANGCRCLMGWAEYDFYGSVPGRRDRITPGRFEAFRVFVATLQDVLEEMTGEERSVIGYNDHILKTNRQRATAYRRAVVRSGYTEVVR